MNNDLIADLAATLDGHQVTNEEGNIEETTSSTDQTADPAQNTTEEESTQSTEKSAESKTEVTHTEEEETEPNAVEDESGKRYVPEKRFKEVYAKAKEAERKYKDMEAQMLLNPQARQPQQQVASAPVAKEDLLEIEILKGKLPQFDQDSPEYSEELDTIGSEIYRANPGITRIEAAKRAIKFAENIAAKVSNTKLEARVVKTLQSDQGLTSRVGREPSTPNTDNMSEKEMEVYLKANGLW